MIGRRRGFTLIELLVVIGVIAILAALLFPVLADAKKSAMRTRCQSNLTQIARAFEAYTGDYDSCYPNTGSQYLWAGFYWRETIKRYVGLGAISADPTKRQMLLACPCDPTPAGIYAGTSYAYSASFYMTPEQVNAVSSPDHIRAKFAATNPKLPCSTIKTSSVRLASKKVLVTEYWTLHAANPKVGWYDDPSTGNDPWSGSRNYLFADGHVKYLATRQIRPSHSLPDINLTVNGVAGRDVD